MKTTITFAAEGTRLQVKEDLNQQARQLYQQHQGSRAFIAAAAQEAHRQIGAQDPKHGEHVEVYVEIHIDVTAKPSEAEQRLITQ